MRLYDIHYNPIKEGINAVFHSKNFAINVKTVEELELAVGIIKKVNGYCPKPSSVINRLKDGAKLNSGTLTLRPWGNFGYADMNYYIKEFNLRVVSFKDILMVYDHNIDKILSELHVKLYSWIRQCNTFMCPGPFTEEQIRIYNLILKKSDIPTLPVSNPGEKSRCTMFKHSDKEIYRYYIASYDELVCKSYLPFYDYYTDTFKSYQEWKADHDTPLNNLKDTVQAFESIFGGSGGNRTHSGH